MDNEHVEPATRFSPNEAPGGTRDDLTESYKRFYRRLSAWHGANGDWKWSDQRRVSKRDRSAILDAISGQLELKDFQKERALRILEDLPEGTLRGNPTALLCIVSAAHACRPDGRKYHPKRADDNNDDLFQSLLGGFDYSEKQIRKVYNRVGSLTND